jgi:ribonuclease HepT-like protein
MDAVGLEILERELAADRKVLADAAGKAQQRVSARNPGHLEACAYELARFYTVFERMLLNICEAFENHFEYQGDWHEKLIARVMLDLPGLRPAFLPESIAADVREIKRFRHLVRHAYDLTLREDRMRELVGIATRVSAAVPEWSASFVGAVRRGQGWS